jgi:hypothetical protein
MTGNRDISAAVPVQAAAQASHPGLSRATFDRHVLRRRLKRPARLRQRLARKPARTVLLVWVLPKRPESRPFEPQDRLSSLRRTISIRQPMAWAVVQAIRPRR